jgi:hypothetical protein
MILEAAFSERHLDMNTANQWEKSRNVHNILVEKRPAAK